MTSRAPIAAQDLEVHETEDGAIVYQELTGRVHHLNRTAAVILALCDGANDTEQIAGTLAEVFDLGEPPIQETKTCIEELSREGLLS
jgi:PqqD family protein of HPr-rel-A system